MYYTPTTLTIKKKKIKMDTAEPEISALYPTHSSYCSKHGAYITHNATRPLSDITVHLSHERLYITFSRTLQDL